LVLALLASAVSAGAQSAPAVDFARDVRPIFEAHCVRCHGPEQQMGGFRLDRRADALRGGTQSDIGPGNAEGSRLYHRLVGTNFGPRMPLGESGLSDEQIEIVKRWIDEGTPWPDAVSGETAPLPINPEANQLVMVFRNGAAAAARSALANVSKDTVNGRGSGGETPLMAAALYGDTALVKRLIALGADVEATSPARTTALMWAVPDVAKMHALLDAGADVDARTDDGRTALLIASGTAGAAAAVRLLLEYGADTTGAGDVTPLREAARVNDVAVFQLLLTSGGVSPATVAARYVRSACAGCAALVHAGDPLPKEPPESNAAATAPLYDPSRLAIPTPIGPTPVTAEAVRAAVRRTLPLLEQVSGAFVRQTGCASCHHNSLVSLATSAARAHGYTVDESPAQPAASFMPPYLESWRERALQNIPIAGGPDTVSYLLVGMAADGYVADAASDAQAIGLARRQQADGHWALQTLRPPIESNDIEVTSMSMRALQLFAPPSRRGETAKAVERARVWLENAVPMETEELVFKLLGLSWAGARKPVISAAAEELLAAQRDDGGWSQSERRASDAYATGEAIVALREGGVAATHPAIRRGVAFLLRTQFEDGTWFVESRSVPIQAYFESGFPFGRNQWISAAASAWATWALVLAE
jgi:hypothetical protein